MKTATQKFNNVIKEGVKPILKEQGFKKKGLHFFKSLGPIGYALNIQKDRYNTKAEIKFTINVGIYSELYWLSEFDYAKTKVAPEFPKEEECILRARIGMLKYGRDYWYEVSTERMEWTLVKEIHQDVEQYALPFFSIKTNDELIESLKTEEFEFKLFILLASTNQQEEAQALFNKLKKSSAKVHLAHLETLGEQFNIQ